MDSELCTIILSWSEGFKIRCAVIILPVWQRSDALPQVCVHFKISYVAVQHSSHVVSLATRIAVIIGDVIVILVTWSKTSQLYRESRHLGIKAPLATLMFRDGE